MHTFQGVNTSSLEQHHMRVWDHQRRWRLASPISSDPDIQKLPPLMHLLYLQANQSA